ncbi:MAG: hypothetical protein Q9184_008503, partial [Pyrenodesmia sp. 2 TL-2023]
TGRLKFLIETVPHLLDVNVTTTTTAIIDAVQRRYGQKIPLRQAQKVKRELAGRVHGPCRYCRMEGHSRRNCPLRKERETAGIMAPPEPEDTGPQPFQYATHNLPPGEVEEYHRPPDERRCTLCLHPGHNRGNCPTRETTPIGLHTIDRPSYPDERPLQPSAYSIPHDSVGHDDEYVNPEVPTSNHPAQTNMPITPQSRVDPALEQSHPAQRTPKEVQAEAARLMQEAARLMNEAALMNAEAARLTASIHVP